MRTGFDPAPDDDVFADMIRELDQQAERGEQTEEDRCSGQS